jgi:hypothetical protein
MLRAVAEGGAGCCGHGGWPGGSGRPACCRAPVPAPDLRAGIPVFTAPVSAGGVPVADGAAMAERGAGEHAPVAYVGRTLA